MLYPAVLLLGALAPFALSPVAPSPVAPSPASPLGTLQASPGDAVLAIRDGDLEFSVTRAEYRDWLVRRYGHAQLGDYRAYVGVQRAAAEKGIAVTDEEVEQRTQSQIEQRIEAAFGGDREKWIAELASASLTPEGLSRTRRLENRKQITAEKLVLATREVTPEAIEQEWVQRYGPGGTRFEVRSLAVRLLQPTPPDGTSQPERQRLREEARVELEGRMQALYEQLVGGADFEEYIERFADDPIMQKSAGRFEQGFPPPTGWPEEQLAHLGATPIGGYAPPVYSGGAYHVLRLEGRSDVPLESVRDELLEELRVRAPSAPEVIAMLGTCAAALSIEVLPEMLAPGPRPEDEVLLRIGGADVTRAEYGAWVWDAVAENSCAAFGQSAAILWQARQAECLPTPEATRARAEEETAAYIRSTYHDNRDRFLASIAGRFADEAQFTESGLEVAELLLAAECLMLRERSVTDEQVERLWIDRYGAGGRLWELRLMSLEVPRDGEGTQAERHEQTRALAERLRERLENGEDFAALAAHHSAHPSRTNGGQLEAPVSELELPAALAESLQGAKAGQFAGPVEESAPRPSFLIAEVLALHSVPLADVAAELRRELETRRPPETERAGWMNTVLKGLDVERLPAFYAQ